MSEIFKIVCNANDYPNQTLMVRPLQMGDEFIIMNTNEVLIPGQRYNSYDSLVVKEVIFKPRKWWQFWKRREILGYVVRCIKE